MCPFFILIMFVNYIVLQLLFFFFFNDTATTEIYTLSLHDAFRSHRRRRQIEVGGHASYRFRRAGRDRARSEEHTSELQSHVNLVCRLLLEKNKNLNVERHVQTLFSRQHRVRAGVGQMKDRKGVLAQIDADVALDFFFNDTATTEIYTLSLHDALPSSRPGHGPLDAAFSLGEMQALVTESHALGRRDRKSTRLNSSHMSISYAVFC